MTIYFAVPFEFKYSSKQRLQKDLRFFVFVIKIYIVIEQSYEKILVTIFLKTKKIF